jgi:hypothetical protein
MNQLISEIKILIKKLQNENLSQKEYEETELAIFRKCFELKQIKKPIKHRM